MNTPLQPQPSAEAILLVNDRDDQLLSLTAMLEPLGVEVVTVNSGPEALRLLLRRDFSVTLLDVNMPEMDGFEIAEAIRQRPRSTLTPIIFVSASHHDEIDRLRGYETGAFDYVTVPVAPSILRAKVSAFLNMHRMHAEIRQQAERLSQLNAQLSERNNALKELQQSKDLLTGMMVHDMRNPLAACLGGLELAAVQAQRNGNEPSRHLLIATSATLVILEMVNGIVDIMRMEDGKMPNNPEVTDLGALIKGRVDQYCSAAITNGVNLTHHIGRTVGSYLTDGALLARVIDNLVVNAIKHTRQGGNIIISAQRQPDNGLVIAVTDTGEGIPPEALSGLFQKYGRVEGQQLGRTYDSGLGLVFCKMAVELLGGSIGVTSARDEGTSFTMAFPPE